MGGPTGGALRSGALEPLTGDQPVKMEKPKSRSCQRHIIPFLRRPKHFDVPTDLKAMPPSRLILQVQVSLLRLLGLLLGVFHRLLWPQIRRYSFKRSFTATVSAQPGVIDLFFYTPLGYRSSTAKYPVVLNFHGGGFVLGTPADDVRWAQVVLNRCDAVFVSVGYRMAPEHPFPTAVEDGADAMRYLVEHADELNIDVTKIATSGFSAGGNLAITVPLRWQEVKTQLKRRDLPVVDFVAAVAWYPALDYTLSRAERRLTCVRPEKTLPKALTDIFDASYLYPPSMDLAHPYLSPAVAPNQTLQTLPHDIILYTCEFDMLQAEGERFRDRCESLSEKRVSFRMVKNVTHGWDKNPFLNTTGLARVDKLYTEACDELNGVFSN